MERAAVELLAQRGAAAVTTAAIAERAGVSSGAMFRHFKSKDELAAVLFRRHYLAFGERLRTRLPGRDRASERIYEMVREVYRLYDADPALFAFLLLTQHEGLRQIDRQESSPLTVAQSVVGDAIADGYLPPQDVDLATAYLMGVVLQPATFAAYGRILGPLAPRADQTATAALAALGVGRASA